MYWVEKRVPFQNEEEVRVALRDAIIACQRAKMWCDPGTHEVLTKLGLPGLYETSRYESGDLMRSPIMLTYRDLVCFYHGKHWDREHESWGRHDDGESCRTTDIDLDLRQGRRIFIPVGLEPGAQYYMNRDPTPDVNVAVDPSLADPYLSAVVRRRIIP